MEAMYPDPNQQNQNPYQAPPQPTPPSGIPPAQPAPPTSVPPASPQPSTPQYSIDYLNQIAPAPAKKNLFGNRLLVAIAGGGLVLVLLVGALSLLSGGSGPTKNMQTFAARVQTLEKIVSSAQKNIKSNDLRATNSNLSIFLANTDQGMTDPLEKNGVSVTKLDKTITTAESGTDLSAKLEDARLNAVFDRTYSREMSYQLTALETLMKTIYGETKSKSMKSYLQTTDDSLVPIKKQFDTFNATSS
jgi:hypothetical protein